jgi:hypothetical protein
MKKSFKDIENNTVFEYNSLQYKKIEVKKISCCRSVNAEDINDPKNRILVGPNVEVEVNDQ